MAVGIPIGIVFFVDSTLFSAALMLAGRHDVQGMAAFGLIFEWSALAIMVPVGLSEAIVQRVARATGTEGSQRTSIATITKAALMTAVAYVAILALIHFGFGSMFRSISLSMPRPIRSWSHGSTIWRSSAFLLPPFTPSSSFSPPYCVDCWM